MQKKALLLIASILLILQNSSSQQVSRKGTTPITKTNNKQGKPEHQYELEQFMGKWQEVKRMLENKKELSIGDTIYLHFTPPDKLETRDGTKNIMRGYAMIEEPGNMLIAAADIYTIMSVKPNQIILYNDEGFIHILEKKELFWRETLGKNEVTEPSYVTPVSFKIADIIGSWNIYRRKGKPGALDSNTVFIKNIKNISTVNDNTATADITCYTRAKSETLPCTILVKEKSVEIKAGSHVWNLLIYKADGKELVFGNADMLIYFAKPL